MNYTYLLINFFTILIPFAFSFHPKLRFYKKWKAFFPAVFLTGLVFVIWDIWFTHLGIWGFNARHITGLEIANLPLEEVLFFFCIPYACVFTFHCLNLFLKDPLSPKTTLVITNILIAFLLAAGVVFNDKIYTISTFISLAILLALSQYVFKIKWLDRFYVVYALLLLPFFIVNGLLTGTGLDEPVVWYNESEMMGLRISTIPAEDVFYGMELILANLLLFNYFKKTYR